MTVEIGGQMDPASLDLPATFSNKFQAIFYPKYVRLVFAEADGAQVRYRVAVALTSEDTKELITLLTNGLAATAGPEGGVKDV